MADKFVDEQFDIGKLLSNPLNGLLFGLNPQMAQLVQMIAGQRQQAEERTYRRTQQERDYERQNRLDTETSAYRKEQLANMRADNARADAAARTEQEQKASELRTKTEQEKYKRTKDTTDQRADLSKQGGEYVATPSELLFGNKVTNRGNIIPSVDNKGFYRLPNQQQVEERELKLAKAKGEAELNLDVEKRKRMSPIELEDYERKQQIESQYRPAKDNSNAVYAEQDSVQKLIDKAKAHEAAGEKTEAAAMWDAAETAGKNASQRFPQLESGRGSNGHVYIKQREGMAKSGAVQTGVPAASTLTRAQYLDYVKRRGKAKADAFVKKYNVTVQ
jgi:hypothetical protein